MIQYRIVCALQDSLSTDERRRFNKQIANNDRLCRLTDFLSRNDSVGLAELLVALYGDERKSARDAFRKLCDKYIAVFLQLISDTGIAEWNQFSFNNAALASTAVKKNILFIQLLTQRRAPDDWLLELTHSLAGLCRKFGLVEDLAVVLTHRYHISIRCSRQDIAAKVLHEQSDVLESVRFLLEMEHFLFDFIALSISGLERERWRIGLLESKVIDCSLMYQKTGLEFIFFIQLILQIRIVYANWDIITAHKLIIELNRLMRSNSEIAYRLESGSIGAILGNNSPSELMAGNSADGILNSQLYRFPSLFALVLEPMVLELYYSGRYDEARKLLFEMMNADPGFYRFKYASRLYLMMSYIHLMLKDKNGVVEYMRKAERTMNDQFQWIISFRLLKIYFMIHFEEWNFARLRIDSLRKFIERKGLRVEIRTRDTIVFRLLMSLSRSAFDFEKVSLAHSRDLELLRSSDPDLKWIPGSFEFIVFDRWFNARATGKNYDIDTEALLTDR